MTTATTALLHFHNQRTFTWLYYFSSEGKPKLECLQPCKLKDRREWDLVYEPFRTDNPFSLPSTLSIL